MFGRNPTYSYFPHSVPNIENLNFFSTRKICCYYLFKNDVTTVHIFFFQFTKIRDNNKDFDILIFRQIKNKRIIKSSRFISARYVARNVRFRPLPPSPFPPYARSRGTIHLKSCALNRYTSEYIVFLTRAKKRPRERRDIRNGERKI